MIVPSAVLVLLAVALLVVGVGDELTDEGLGFLYGSMACSLLAVLVLLYGVLQRRGPVGGAAQGPAPRPVEAEPAPPTVEAPER